MSLWKKTMDYLGLGPDDAYDDYDDPVEEPPARSPRSTRDAERVPGRGSAPRGWPSDNDDSGGVRAVPARPSFPSRDFDASRRNGGDESMGAPRSSRESNNRNAPPPPPSRPAAPAASAEPSTIKPRRFDQAQELADRFKEGQPVILNLEAAERDVARRLIDFASGLCYAMDGSMEKVATGVYLLKPAPTRAQIDDFAR